MEMIKVKVNHWVYGVCGANSYEANEGDVVDIPPRLAELFAECGFVSAPGVRYRVKESTLGFFKAIWSDIKDAIKVAHQDAIAGEEHKLLLLSETLRKKNALVKAQDVTQEYIQSNRTYSYMEEQRLDSEKMRDAAYLSRINSLLPLGMCIKDMRLSLDETFALVDTSIGKVKYIKGSFNANDRSKLTNDVVIAACELIKEREVLGPANHDPELHNLINFLNKPH